METKKLSKHGDGAMIELFMSKKIGTGSFGQVYLGIDNRTGKLVAIKIEKRQRGVQGMLETEFKVLQHIDNVLPPDEPHMHSHYFTSDRGSNYLVIDLLGDNLETLRTREGCFNLKTTLMVAIQLLDRLRAFHGANLIHRDIKPENFMTDYKYPHKNIYMIDFGFSKEYKRDDIHIQKARSEKTLGTPRFMSVNAHEGWTLSRRDDLISLLYSLLFLHTGTLPWQGDSDETMIEKKLVLKFKDDVDSFFGDFKDYSYALDFDSDIDYEYLVRLAETSLTKHGWRNDSRWQWL